VSSWAAMDRLRPGSTRCRAAPETRHRADLRLKARGSKARAKALATGLWLWTGNLGISAQRVQFEPWLQADTGQGWTGQSIWVQVGGGCGHGSGQVGSRLSPRKTSFGRKTISRNEGREGPPRRGKEQNRRRAWGGWDNQDVSWHSSLRVPTTRLQLSSRNERALARTLARERSPA
jgi:hypothetical protein